MFGGILIKIGFLAALASSVLYFLSTRRDNGSDRQIARASYHGAVVALMTASAYLLYLILTHNFQFTYVWSYSSSDLPLPLLMSTMYAGQEGSFMLWALFTSIIGVFLTVYYLAKVKDPPKPKETSLKEILSETPDICIRRSPFRQVRALEC